ncbi:hypothetical protein H2200_011465 [Cladophialophora chaetospira]|uniref:Peptidase S54 rhomboid domain-containing protein n=1 Tax=Cladophialophora chaetospira TaxID=386627 RepID=A0AA38WZG2_9EURO|nr:hypothetical protein H2200_011465 [Cladophialophora chaetospira]
MFNFTSCSRLRVGPSSSSIRPFFGLSETQPNAQHFSQLYGPGRTLSPRPSPFFSSRTSRPPSRNYTGPSGSNNNYTFNRNLTYGCIGTAITVYAAWDYSRRGVIYSFLAPELAYLQQLGVPVQKALNTRAVSDFLNKYFLLHSNDTSLSASWLGSAFSHHSILHMGLNLLVWSNFARLLFPLSRVHYATIILGSALTSSAAWVYDAQRKYTSGNAAALGSSGIVSGVMTAATMFYPTLQASLFGILPMPLWVLTSGFLALDYYLMESPGASRIGHSAHLGGAAFSFLYYTLFLRRYGGIFGSRRF